MKYDKSKNISIKKIGTASRFLFISSIISVLFLFGCGDGNNEKNTSTTQPLTLDESTSVLKQPKTDSDYNEKIVYQSDSEDNFEQATKYEADIFFNALPDEEKTTLTFEHYLNGYRHGINDVRRANAITVNNSEPSYEKGYNTGYEYVLTTMGIDQLNLPETVQQEAIASFMQSEFNSNNPVLKHVYLTNFICGARSVLSSPVGSIENMDFLTEEDNEEDATIQEPPKENDPMAVKVRYAGFKAGKKTMRDSIKASFENFMNQFQDGQMDMSPNSDP